MDPTPPDPSTPSKVFGSRVRARRLELEWTQEELARRAGVHITHLSALEGGKPDPKLSLMAKLAFALGMDLSELTFRILPPGRSRRPRSTRPPADDAPTTDT